VYDALLLPALNYAERDRMARRLSEEEESSIIDATRELVADAAELIRRKDAGAGPDADGTAHTGPHPSLAVLAYPVNGTGDALALEMLARAADDTPIAIEIVATRLQASELIALVKARGVSVVCLADLPPSAPSKTRYFVKRLRSALPDLRIVAGRWAPGELADDSTQLLRDAGATLVASTLLETTAYLRGLADVPAAA